MKIIRHVVLCFLLLSGFNSLSQSISLIDTISFYESKSLRKSFGNTVADYPYENADIHYSRCEWVVDPAVNSIEGKITSGFTALSDLDSLTFDCSQYLSVDSVVFHSAQISFSRRVDLLKVFFPATISVASSDSVSIYYHDSPVSTGNGSFEQSLHAGVPVMWTLSEPYGAMDWWPCRQNAKDKIDSIDIYCKVPAGNKCASNGKLISVDTLGSQLLFHWKSNYAIAPYLVAIAVTNYDVFVDSVVLSNSDTLQVLNYLYPEQISFTQPALSVTPSLISYYDSLLITYPFSKEKYGHAQFGWGGGMEHQTMSFVGSFGFELIAHELVHQWFGDEVTCRNWSDIWLHEGFATFLAGSAIERFKPAEYYSWKYSALQDIVSKPNGSVICPDTSDISRIFNGRLSYRKGAYVLNMLRWELGDSLFVLSLREFLNNTAHQFNYATTADLKAAFENVSGNNLSQFFDEWVYGEGFPVYKIKWSRSGNAVDMSIEQTTSDPGIAFFHIPVPIQIGNSSTDTIVVADPSYSGQSFHFELNFKPDFVAVDPELQIISGNNKVQEELPPGSINDLIVIYPNPTSGMMDVFAKRNSLKMDEFSIMDYCGKIVYKQKFVDGFKATIDLSGMSAGAYVIEIKTDVGQIHQKIIVQY